METLEVSAWTVITFWSLVIIPQGIAEHVLWENNKKKETTQPSSCNRPDL